MRLLLTSLVAIALLSCATPPNPELRPAISGNYVLDPSHASVTWSLSHAGLSQFTARFDEMSGTLAFDAENPANSQVDIHINPASVSTGLPDFDKTISEDNRYFDTTQYPDIRFVSTSVEKITDNQGRITGDLSFRGQVKPVVLDVTFNGAGRSFGHPGETLGFSATGILSRSDFGLTYLTNFGIGDEVSLRIEAEFNEKQ